MKFKKLIALLCVILCFGSFLVPANAESNYTQRTAAPSTDNKFFYDSKYNPFYTQNLWTWCTWYAYGRAGEILNKKPDLPISGAAKWFSDNKSKYDNGKGGYPYSTDYYSAKVGAVACYNNHVQIVESVASDGTPDVISSGGWDINSQDEAFKVKNTNWSVSKGFKYGKSGDKSNKNTFKGYIYVTDKTSNTIQSTNRPETIPVISVTTQAASEITSTSVTLNGKLSANTTVNVTEHGAYLGTSASNMTLVAKDKVNHNKKTLTMLYGSVKYGITLQPDATYYYQEYAVVNGKTYKGDIVSFKTLPNTENKNPSVPSIKIDKAEIKVGDKAIVSWNADKNAAKFNVYVNGKSVGTVTGTSYTLSGLSEGSYTIKVSAEGNGICTADSNAVSLKVSKTSVIVTTNPATEIKTTSAKLNGSLSADKNVHITEHGAYLGTSTSNMTRVAKDTVDYSKKSLTMLYTTTKYGVTLQPNTTYYFYEYAVVDGVTYKGEILSFTTEKDGTTPANVIVTTKPATEITATSAKLNGSLSASRSVHITEHGAYLGTSTSNMTRVAKDTVDHNKSSLTMYYSTSKYGTTLQPNTTYYFYEYAVVDGVTYKGDILSFTTEKDGTTPANVIVTTKPATEITATSAKLNGSLSADKNVHITEHGVYLCINNTFTCVARDTVDYSKKSLTMFYSTSKYGVTLQPDTTYYFYEYAVVDGMTYEGDLMAFTTAKEETPAEAVNPTINISVSTNSATNITQTSAQLNGSLSASDKVHVTEHGAYLGTSTFSMTRVAKDSVDKNVSSLTMFYSTSKYGTTLKAGTTYYFYQYAVIDGVTYKGDILSFTTAAETKTENTRKGVVTSDGYLAINDKPAASPANSTKIGRIPSGATVTVYPDKTSGNWYWVSYDGVSGYAYSKYIKLQ